MTDSEYLTLAEAALAAIERALDDTEADIEFERSGNVLTLEFENRTKMIVNLQPPMREIWLAAKAGGFHYQFIDGEWRNTRGGREFFAALSSTPPSKPASRCFSRRNVRRNHRAHWAHWAAALINVTDATRAPKQNRRALSAAVFLWAGPSGPSSNPCPSPGARHKPSVSAEQIHDVLLFLFADLLGRGRRRGACLGVQRRLTDADCRHKAVAWREVVEI